MENHTDAPEHDAEVGRHRLPRKLAGRTPYLAAALVALVGLGIAGVSAAVTPDGGSDSSVAMDERARVEAADRANRSERDSAAEPTPSATDTTLVSPSPSTSTPAGETATKESKPAAQESTPAQKKATTVAKPKADWVHPMPGAETTSCFGQRWGVLHAGIDLALPANTPIRAAAAGTVTTAGWAFTGYGISVVIDHGNGYLTHYAHMNATAVSVGQKVSPGTVIGYEGSTGDSTGPHLHFEVHNGLWNQLDPGPWMRARGVNLGC
ncbi:M23 family metallopeptidase [Micromonospora sonneratiae]|uniref:M23 family metallopeptidase n=1 Tax=Micromonospora sonneratiae TaxID=1184706 RepID=A0ABW3YP50_9ACTN